MNTGIAPKTLAITGGALLFAACSSSSSGPDVTAPTISSAMQNRTVDPLGFTVDVRMNEALDATSANLVSNWSTTVGTITSAVLQPDLVNVRLTLDSVAVPGDVTFGTIAGVPATGNIDLTAQVTDGDTITVSDGTDSFTFEFTSGGGAMGNNIEVDKGASATDAIAAFITAFNGVAALDITAAAGAGDSADLTHDELGRNGNVPITETDAGGVITLTGMAGGAGLQDLAGNVIDTAINGIALATTDLVAPAASTLAGVTVSGVDNDRVQVVFNDDMIESEVEMLASWTVEAPVGTAFDLTGSTIDYDPMTRTATLTLGAGVPGVAGDANNLQTNDTIAASFTTMRDVSGNAITATTIGVDAVNGLSNGDDVPPAFVAVVADGVGNSVDVLFSEPVLSVAFGDLYAGGTDPGPRFLLTDADAPATPATGTITIGGDPLDGETFVIDDGGGNTDTFEWESAGGVGVGNIAVAITAGNNNQMATDLAAAITGGTVNITPAAATNTVGLTHDVAGTVGNVAITGAPTNVTISGMSGGTDMGPALATINSITFSPDNLRATVDYGTTVPNVGADTIELYGIRDLAGNSAFAVAAQALSMTDAAEPAIDAGNSSFNVIANKNNDIITVRFDRPMNPFYLTEPTNYMVPGLDLSNALFTILAANEVFITLNGLDDQNLQFGQNYSLTLVSNAGTPLTSAVGTELSANDIEMIVSTGDGTAPSEAMTSAYVGDALNPNSCVVIFPEAVIEANALALANYGIGGTNPTAIQMINARVFRLTFPSQPAAAEVLDIEVAAATDIAGNAAAAQFNIALTGVDTVRPTATLGAVAFENRGEEVLSVTFSEAIDLTTGLNPANYSFVHDGLAVDLSQATPSYNSDTNRVIFRLPDTFELRFGATVTGTVTGVRDLSGNALLAQPAGTTVSGDNASPTLDSAFVNYIASGTGTMVDVSFSEDVDVAFTTNAANWSTTGATVVTAVELVGSNIARVTTNAQIGAGEMLQVVPTDLAGNNAAGLSAVDPRE